MPNREQDTAGGHRVSHGRETLSGSCVSKPFCIAVVASMYMTAQQHQGAIERLRAAAIRDSDNL